MRALFKNFLSQDDADLIFMDENAQAFAMTKVAEIIFSVTEPDAEIVISEDYRILNEEPNDEALVVCSILLNDDFEGGDFSFRDECINKSDHHLGALIYVPDPDEPHEVSPITSGERNILYMSFRRVTQEDLLKVGGE